MEKDCSDEATNIVDRTSRAILDRDMRAPLKAPVKGDDSSDEEIKMQDLCPSWMGQIYQV